MLAEAVRSGLVARGFETDVRMLSGEGRVTVVSRSEAVWRAELGSAGTAPSAPLSGVARGAAAGVMARLRDRVEEALR